MIEEGEIEMEEKVENSHKMEDVPKAEDKHKMEEEKPLKPPKKTDVRLRIQCTCIALSSPLSYSDRHNVEGPPRPFEESEGKLEVFHSHQEEHLPRPQDEDPQER